MPLTPDAASALRVLEAEQRLGHRRVQRVAGGQQQRSGTGEDRSGEGVRELIDPPADGVEIGGRFYESDNVWERRGEIPARDEIATISGSTGCGSTDGGATVVVSWGSIGTSIGHRRLTGGDPA